LFNFLSLKCMYNYYLCCSVRICCGAVYKNESNDLILIDVARFKPCQRRQHGSLAHLTAVAREMEITDNNGGLISPCYNSADSSSTRAVDLAGQSTKDLVGHNKPDQDIKQSSRLPSSVYATKERDCEDDDEYEDNDSCSVLQTDESMEAASPSQDTDEDVDTTMSASSGSIFCKLLWNNRHGQPFTESNSAENQRSFVWSEMQSKSINIWPSTHALSKPSPVKVFP